MPDQAASSSAHPPGRGFDFTLRMAELCADIVARLPELAHIDMNRVALSFSQARKRVRHGMVASLTPMRFENGSLTGKRNGQDYSVQRLYAENGREMLYILTFFLPRFMDFDLNEKLTTILHELWHISPQFDGDLRRHPGRFYVHSGSQREYDAHAEQLAKQWLDLEPPQALYHFLSLDFRGLADQHQGVFGNRIPHPKLIKIEGEASRDKI